MTNQAPTAHHLESGQGLASIPLAHAVHAAHGGQDPSPWVQRWTHLLPPGTRVLDLACGAGRHSHWLAAHGMAVWSVDRDEAALARVRDHWPNGAPHAPHTLCMDLENGPWPLGGETFGAVVVTNYLWRPLWPHLLAALAPGGVLVVETFAHGNASVGKPSRPDFLLQTGELLSLCQSLQVVAYENGFCTQPDRYVQRVVAVRIPSGAADLSPPAAPPRFALTPPPAPAHAAPGPESIE
jgi:SAM-dependent methyltransferase